MITQDYREKLSKEVASVKVIPLNIEKINQDVDKNLKAEIEKAKGSIFAPEIKEGETFYLRGALGIIQGTNMVIDEECVGEMVEHDDIHLHIYSQTITEKGKSFSLSPRFTVTNKLSEMIKEYGQEPVSLESFMGSRFAYNDRIVSNTRIILKEIKK